MTTARPIGPPQDETRGWANREIILGMLIVAIAWIYVVGMASIAEALSPQGSVLGAIVTFTFYGVLPLAVVLYLLGTPGRKRARRRAEATEAAGSAGSANGSATGPAPSAAPVAGAGALADAATDPPSGSASGLQPDGGRHAARSATRLALPVAPERKEP